MFLFISLLLMFHTDLLLPHSPVKQQGGTASCWAFSMCSYWETENAIAIGSDSIAVEYSPWYLARHKIVEDCNSQMSQPLARPAHLSVGAMAQTAICLRQQQGIVKLQDYEVPSTGQGKGFRWMMRGLKLLTWVGQYTYILRPLCTWLIDILLDARWGKLPSRQQIIETPFLSPKSYTSFAHYPFQQEVVPDFPDNYQAWACMNLPIDQLVQMMISHLQSGHSLVWQGCVRYGFSSRKGMADLKNPIQITDDLRSKEYLKGHITDDHMMHIVGMATDETGKRYFIAKNSVGDVGPYHGLVYMSEDFVRMFTTAVTL